METILVRQNKLRILIYCSDANGMGNTSRTLSIATRISEQVDDCAILLLTDLPIIGRYKCPQNMDYVHLPGIARGDRHEYEARNLNIALNNTLTLRHKITKSAIKTFKPDIILIQSNPSDLPHEIEHTFGFVKQRFPETRIIWGLPDILGRPAIIKEEWQQKDVYGMLDRICDEVWIHGVQHIFDATREYEFPESLAQKTTFTGYMSAPNISREKNHRDTSDIKQDNPYVLVTAGSGTEGYALVSSYLEFLENQVEPLPFSSVIITGPMMASYEKSILMDRAERLPNVTFHRFSKNILQYLKYAELVVCNGGFNLFCEISSYDKHAIFVPGETMHHEHLYRAQVLEDLGLVELISPNILSAGTLGRKVMKVFSMGPTEKKYDMVPRNALEHIVERVQCLSANVQLSLYHSVLR